ncbi:MAG: CsgG/HfaB family protein [Leptothrix ochracea]|uniref:CsgG/HfaB family protein n=1 Tax=Leptothrix ochracea TaxID=735331 RepID=UPI0034E2E0AA
MRYRMVINKHGVLAVPLATIWVPLVLLAGCAVQTPPVSQRESLPSPAAQRQAQQAVLNTAPAVPQLKRKIALGRISNETHYGQSLLRDAQDDPLGKQVTDMLSKALTASGRYLVFERPDLGRVKEEGKLTGAQLNVIGVDALIVGSLTEFGRKNIGQTGFLSDSKRQVAFAKIDVRLVDTSTAHVFFATSGAGEASVESASTLGFGSTASYDGTLNDAAIRQAVSDVVSRLGTELSARPWQTAFLAAEQGQIFLAGGKAQGLTPGMVLAVLTVGKKIKSPQTGFDITLPGQEVAKVRVDALFGDSEATEGSVVSVVSGSLAGHKLTDLVVRQQGGQ